MTLICSRGDGSRVREGLPSRHSGTPARPPHTNLRARRVDCGVERPRDLESCSSAFTSLVIACRSASPACMADGDAGRLEQAFDDVASMLDERLLRAADCAQAGRCVTACDDIECARRVSHRCRLVTLNDIQHVKFAVCIVTTRSPTLACEPSHGYLSLEISEPPSNVIEIAVRARSDTSFNSPTFSRCDGGASSETCADQRCATYSRPHHSGTSEGLPDDGCSQ